MSKPLVSVIIPAFNKAEYTRRVVESVIAQTYPNIEILVIDDGSTDQTQEVLSLFQNKIVYVRKTNGGACSARNQGARLAKGEYLAFIDCDDLYYAQKIESSIRYLQEHPAIGFVHTAASFINENDIIIQQHKQYKNKQFVLAKQLILGNYICNSTVVVRRHVFEKAGFFDETIFAPADWDMWIRLSLIMPGGYIPEPLTKYRITDNFIINRLDLSAQEEKYVIEKNMVYFTGDFLLKQQAWSNYYYRYAIAYFIKDDLIKFNNFIKRALQYNIFNIKAWIILLGRIFMQNKLKKELSVRILRKG